MKKGDSSTASFCHVLSLVGGWATPLKNMKVSCSGWWLTYQPSWKVMEWVRQWEGWHPINDGKFKKKWNHQPVFYLNDFLHRNLSYFFREIAMLKIDPALSTWRFFNPAPRPAPFTAVGPPRNVQSRLKRSRHRGNSRTQPLWSLRKSRSAALQKRTVWPWRRGKPPCFK